MTEIKKEIVVELAEPIEYAYKGSPATGSFVTLMAPTSKNMGECAFLKQAFFRALPQGKDGDDKGGDNNHEFSGEEIMQLIMISHDVELKGVLIAARELFKSVGLIDGETKLTGLLLDAISLDDLQNMTGEYLLNFILASALRRPKKV